MAKLDHGKLPKYQNIDSQNSGNVTTADVTDFLLYNIAKDPAESNDLSGTEAEKPASMKTRTPIHLRRKSFPIHRVHTLEGCRF